MDDTVDAPAASTPQPDDPSAGPDPSAEADESAAEADPVPLPGAGGPVGGPVAGETLDAFNQPLLEPDDPDADA
jgi:hypothetical protein